MERILSYCTQTPLNIWTFPVRYWYLVHSKTPPDNHWAAFPDSWRWGLLIPNELNSPVALHCASNQSRSLGFKWAQRHSGKQHNILLLFFLNLPESEFQESHFHITYFCPFRVFLLSLSWTPRSNDEWARLFLLFIHWGNSRLWPHF